MPILPMTDLSQAYSRSVPQAEAEVCTLMCTEGLSSQEGADLQNVFVGTIRSQIKSIYLKTGVDRLPDLVRIVQGI